MVNLREVLVVSDALILIERILASCIDMDKTAEEIRFPGHSSVTLQDLFDRFPVPAVALHSLCVQRKCSAVTRQEVVDLFAGPTHAQAIRERLENPHQIIVATGQLFLERMQEIDVHFERPENKAAFGLFDLATACQVIVRSGQKVNVRVFEKTVSNCVLPPDLAVNKDDWVLCHMGAVITPISEQQELIRIQSLQQTFKVAFLLKGLLNDSEKEIDCRNFCPSQPSKKDGCDLTVWNLDRL